MFEVVKEQLNKEIEELKNQLELLEKKYKLIENKLLAINDFQHEVFKLKEIKAKYIMIGLMDIVAILFSTIVCHQVVPLTAFLTLSYIVCSLFEYNSKKTKVKSGFQKCLAISEIALVDGNKVELLKKLDSKKLNYKVLNTKLLDEVWKILMRQRAIVYSDINNIKSEISDHKYVFIENYEKNSELYNELITFRNTKSIEECNDLLIKYKNAKEIAQTYFEEPTSYSNFSYDYNSGYKEGPKTKLLKKKF